MLWDSANLEVFMVQPQFIIGGYLSSQEMDEIKKSSQIIRDLLKDTKPSYTAADLDLPAWGKVRAEAHDLVLKLHDAESRMFTPSPW